MLAACAKAESPTKRHTADAGLVRDGAPAASMTGQEACTDAGGTCVLPPATGCSTIGTQDCTAQPGNPPAWCCLDTPKTCDESGGSIHASDYDQTCEVDDDCTWVSEGLVACKACSRECTTGLINHNELERYRSALDKLPSPPAGDAICNCPSATTPCCVDGQCVAGAACGGPGRVPL
jgi:hypothetical protein